MGTGRSGLSKGVQNILGKKGKGLFKRYPDISEAIQIINPNYKDEWKTSSVPKSDKELYNMYGRNCALVTTAAALQLKGYDVEAMPRDTTWRGFDSVFNYKWTSENFKSPADTSRNYSGVPWKENFYNTNRFSASDVKGITSEISSQMSDWGTHSFAAMNVGWKGGGAHVIIVYQEKSQTTMIDFQTHSSYTVDEWFKAHPSAKLDSIGLYRLDNQKINKKISDLDKIVKRRS